MFPPISLKIAQDIDEALVLINRIRSVEKRNPEFAELIGILSEHKVRYVLDKVMELFRGVGAYYHGSVLYKKDVSDIDCQIDIDYKIAVEKAVILRDLRTIFSELDAEQIDVKTIKFIPGSVFIRIGKIDITICPPSYRESPGYISYFDSVRLNVLGGLEFKQGYIRDYQKLYKRNPENPNLYPRHDDAYKEVFNQNAQDFYIRAFCQIYYIQNFLWMGVVSLDLKRKFEDKIIESITADLIRPKSNSELGYERNGVLDIMHHIGNYFVKKGMKLMDHDTRQINEAAKVLFNMVRQANLRIPTLVFAGEESVRSPIVTLGAGAGSAGILFAEDDVSDKVENIDIFKERERKALLRSPMIANEGWREDLEFKNLEKLCAKNFFSYIPPSILQSKEELKSALIEFARLPRMLGAVILIHNRAHYSFVYIKKEQTGYLAFYCDPAGLFGGHPVHEISKSGSSCLAENLNIKAENIVNISTRLQSYQGSPGQADFRMHNNYCGYFVEYVASGIVKGFIRIRPDSTIANGARIEFRERERWFEVPDFGKKDSKKLGRDISKSSPDESSYDKIFLPYFLEKEHKIEVLKAVSLFNVGAGVEGRSSIEQDLARSPRLSVALPRAVERVDKRIISRESFEKLLKYVIEYDDLGRSLSEVMLTYLNSVDLKEFIASKKPAAIMPIFDDKTESCSILYIGKTRGGGFKGVFLNPFANILPRAIIQELSKILGNIEILCPRSPSQNYNKGKFDKDANMAFALYCAEKMASGCFEIKGDNVVFTEGGKRIDMNFVKDGTSKEQAERLKKRYAEMLERIKDNDSSLTTKPSGIISCCRRVQRSCAIL